MRQALGALLIGPMLMMGGGIVRAGPYEDGVAAYARGDYATALQLLRPFAARGNAIAQYSLGVMYSDGQGVPQNYTEGLKWLLLSAKQGYAFAQTRLGEKYALGQGVQQNNVTALMWFNLAVGQGADYAAGHRNLVVEKMTSAQIAEAQELARRCAVSSYKQCGEPGSNQPNSLGTSVPMQPEGGVYVVPVLINNVITLSFVVDSGAADVSIPADVVSTLMRMGTLKASDFLGQRTYVLADGSKLPSQTFRINVSIRRRPQEDSQRLRSSGFCL
jgi:TPR repeat protein